LAVDEATKPVQAWKTGEFDVRWPCEPGLHEDYKAWLEGLAPLDASPRRYQHNRTGEDNADAHLKRQVMGREVVVAITAGKLDFGPWEQVFYGEFDGLRPKRVLIKIIGE